MRNKTDLNQKLSTKKKQQFSLVKGKETQDRGYKPKNPQPGSAGGGPILSP